MKPESFFAAMKQYTTHVRRHSKQYEFDGKGYESYFNYVDFVSNQLQSNNFLLFMNSKNIINFC